MSSACVYIRIAAIPNSAPSARRRPNAKGHLPLPCRFLTQSRKRVYTGVGKDPRVGCAEGENGMLIRNRIRHFLRAGIHGLPLGIFYPFQDFCYMGKIIKALTVHFIPPIRFP